MYAKSHNNFFMSPSHPGPPLCKFSSYRKYCWRCLRYVFMDIVYNNNSNKIVITYGTYCSSTKYTLIHLIQTPTPWGHFYYHPILKVRSLRHREVKQLNQCHPVTKWWGWYLNLNSLAASTTPGCVLCGSTITIRISIFHSEKELIRSSPGRESEGGYSMQRECYTMKYSFQDIPVGKGSFGRWE